MNRILIATSNPGKLRDFVGAAAPFGIEINPIPNFASLPAVVEDGQTFEDNARKKAESYSRVVPGEIVLADDSGLEVAALNGAPGVHSARYAADAPHLMNNNTDDQDNNTRRPRWTNFAGVPRRSRRHNLESSSRNERIWLRSPVSLRPDSENLRRIDPRRKSSIQPSRHRIQAVPGLVQSNESRHCGLIVRACPPPQSSRATHTLCCEGFGRAARCVPHFATR